MRKEDVWLMLSYTEALLRNLSVNSKQFGHGRGALTKV